jgi:hypothetical protein
MKGSLPRVKSESQGIGEILRSGLLRLIRGNSRLKRITIFFLRALGAHSLSKKIIVRLLNLPLGRQRTASLPAGEMIEIHGKQLIEKEIWFSRFREALAIRKNHTDFAVQSPKERVKPEKLEITVLISLYQSDEFILNLIEDILRQTAIASAQVIFVSVSPSPFVSKTLENLKLLLPSAQIIESVERIGIYEAWNIGVERAETPLLTNWNADDRRSKTSLEQQISFMRSNPWASGCYGDTYITLDPLASFEIAAYCDALTDLPNYPSIHQALSATSNPMHNAPVWRKNLHTKHGLFDESFVSAGDFEFWLRCQVAGEAFVKSPIPYATYFLNPKGISTRQNTEAHHEIEVIKRKYKKAILYQLKQRNLPGLHSSLYRHNNSLIQQLEGNS